MVSTRRSSARLSQAGVANQTSSTRKTPSSKTRLGSLVERDETPDIVQPSIDGILSTPTAAREVRAQLLQLSNLRTPQTEPRPERGEMHPKTLHQTTSKAPDSGLKLGFADISTSTANHQGTPTKPRSRQSMASPIPSNFQFQFSTDANLSDHARLLMENVREEAAKIKAQMLAAKAVQEQSDNQSENTSGTSRRIANARGKAGRFSDVHMAQFKKMDSIANHPSSFRAQPRFAAPTTAQSLKRSPSKAELDDTDRSQPVKTAPRKVSPPITGRVVSVSPFKSATAATVTSQADHPAKRLRYSEQQRILAVDQGLQRRPSQSSLYSPTKASLARTASGAPSSPQKTSMLPRSNSVKSVKAGQLPQSAFSPIKCAVPGSPSKIPQSQSMQFKPLPTIPVEKPAQVLRRTESVRSLAPSKQPNGFTSKLPTFAGLKSILRSGRKENKSPERPGTPKRPNTVEATSDTNKKVDFTPSVKSRYAVKLAAVSPGPAKPRQDTPRKASDPADWMDQDESIMDHEMDDAWEDEEAEVAYPTISPVVNGPGPVDHTFQAKVEAQRRRESKDFKSIFTTLHPENADPFATLTSVNTRVNKTDPATHANKVMRSPSNHNVKPSPSTIRPVRNSGSNHVTQLVQPFKERSSNIADRNQQNKRGHELIATKHSHGHDSESKENRPALAVLAASKDWKSPGLSAGEDTQDEDSVNEEVIQRSAKRVKTSSATVTEVKAPLKKPNAARETAAKNAKERKGRGVLSMSRLNMLSRPKQRG